MTKANGERLDIDFLANLYKEAKKQYKAPNTSILLAQVILESGLGTSDLALNTNNLAGIKASPPYTGKPYFHSSPEERDGVVKNETSGFRQYDSIEDFVVDHVKFFTSTPTRVNVYKDAYTLPSSQEQADALTGPGKYATDSRYSSKLMNVINQYNLTKYDNVTQEKEVENTMVQLRTPKDKITLVNSFGRHTNTPKYIIIHYVGAVGQAAANANYFYNVVRNASAHIFIDKNETWRVGYDDMAMWHVGKLAV